MKNQDILFEINALIKKRWSPRAFSKESLTTDDMNTLFEAASWAASSINEQPWVYYYSLRDDPEFQEFTRCLNPKNQLWAKDAAALIFSAARKSFTVLEGKANPYAFHDTGMANATLLIQATEMNIFGHVMGGFDKNLSKEIFKLPDDIEPVVFIALGYLGDPDQLNDDLKKRESQMRIRKPVHEFVTRGLPDQH